MCSCGGGGKLRRGLCGRCYQRWIRSQPGSLRLPVVARFEEKVDRSGDCWEWRGTRTPKGYGQFSAASSRHGYAHRWAWEQVNGPIPDGLTVDHLCRNRGCVNPAHMEIVTRGENTRRGQRPIACPTCDRRIVPVNLPRHRKAAHTMGES